ncbi:MAG: hypothetical protein IT457_21100 [Planctomycetes bacterium]|nr:hypothetical protein [Planctomycetota bacterium]
MPTSSRSAAAQSQRGASFLELMVAISIVGVAVLVMLQQLSISHRETDAGRDKVFAYQKGLAMLNELQAAIERGIVTDANQLEAMADVKESFVLSTLRGQDGEPLAPDHPSSGNSQRAGEWIWSRRIEVSPLPGNPRLRRVQVAVRRSLREGGPRQTYAAVASLLNLPNESGATTQVYDVYALALSAVPSTYMALPSLRNTFEAAADELAQRAPGLRFQLHFITELGYGRDPFYAPYFNTQQGATSAAPWVFWYPSKCDQVTPALFAPEHFDGLVRLESGRAHGYDAATNPVPFATADQFNHAMRLPEARKLFEARVAAGLADREAPPLQILLEDLHASPDRYRNAIFINLHGEVLPFPPLRNHADAAREPVGLPGVRVVTHPARLRTERDPDGDGDHADTRDVELRVYAYKQNPGTGSELLATPVTLRIPGVDLTGNVNGVDPGLPATLEIRRLVGGIDPSTGTSGGTQLEYHGFDSPQGVPPAYAARSQPLEMAFECGYQTVPSPHTWIRLYHTPLVAPVVGDQGLFPSSRLYGLDYVPSPVLAPTPGAPDFQVDLASSGLGPKNTARWRIRVPKAVFDAGFPGGGLPDQDQLLSIDTRIGTNLASGTAWPTPVEPYNRSTTHVWWARSPEFVPLTERYQLQGDPRHNPYVDLVVYGNSFANGYNWYFDDLRSLDGDATSDWPCLDRDRLRDGFGGVAVVDVPRIAHVWRRALLRAGVVLSSFGGRFAGAYSLGGDLCLPAEAGGTEPRTLPLHGAAYGLTGYAAVDTLTRDDPENPAAPGLPATFPKIGSVVVRSGDGAFLARPECGELWPDQAYTGWIATGNLAAGVGGSRYQRAPRHEVTIPNLPFGTELDEPIGLRIGALGAATLLQSGTSFATFAQRLEAPLASATVSDGLRALFLAAGVGLTPSVPVRWTMGLAETLSSPLPHLIWVSDYPDHFCQELERLARGPDLRSSSGVVRLMAPGGNERAYLALIGDTPTGSLEQSRLPRAALLYALHGLWVASNPAFDNDVVAVPRVLLIGPEQGAVLADPSVVHLRWRTIGERWDGSRYTLAHPEAMAADAPNLRYRILYSTDNGVTWRELEEGTTTDPHARPSMESLQPDSGFGDESAMLPLSPEKFPAGDYVFRVIAHHRLREAHIAWHDVFVKITRPQSPLGGGEDLGGKTGAK